MTKKSTEQMIPPLMSVPDMRQMMEAQRLNFQALSEAGKLAMTSWQALAQRQADMVSTFAQTQSEIFRESMKEGTPEDKMARQADMFKRAYEMSLETSRDMADMMMKTNREASDMLQKRVKGTLNDLRGMMVNAEDAA
ncbi:MAG: phasin family protein [Alphaproteobacteria bacterium]|nr:phasin family protein [Alphaproteobacteria bacterium]